MNGNSSLYKGHYKHQWSMKESDKNMSRFARKKYDAGTWLLQWMSTKGDATGHIKTGTQLCGQQAPSVLVSSDSGDASFSETCPLHW